MSTLELPNSFSPASYPMWLVCTDDETGRYLLAFVVGYRTYPGGRIESVVYRNGSNVALTSYRLGANPTINPYLGPRDAAVALSDWLDDRTDDDDNPIGPLIDVAAEPRPNPFSPAPDPTNGL